MTDPPVTPRTEAGRDWLRWKYGGRSSGRDYDHDLTRILDIEREAGSTDALRARIMERAKHPTAGWMFRDLLDDPALTASDAGPVGIDVERLAEFFHEEYWAEANEPHWPREQADATDCEVCWSSAAKLHARLSRESDR
jgi:hypothetical protein